MFCRGAGNGQGQASSEVSSLGVISANYYKTLIIFLQNSTLPDLQKMRIYLQVKELFLFQNVILLPFL